MILGAELACRILEGEDPKNFLQRVMPTMKPMLRVGEELIRGTGDTRDIMEACLDALKRLDKARFAAEISDHDVFQYTSLGEIHNDFDPEFYLYERLFSILQKYCPPMAYFGSHEADGSIGCWPIDGEAIEAMVDRDELFYLDARENPEQARAVRSGDFTGISPIYTMIEEPAGGKELWDRRTAKMLWEW